MAIAFAENYSHVQIRNRRQQHMISAGENGLPKQDIDNNWGCREVPVSGVFSKERYKLLVVSSKSSTFAPRFSRNVGGFVGDVGRYHVFTLRFLPSCNDGGIISA